MNGFTPATYTNLHHRYTKPNTIAYFLRAYYVLYMVGSFLCPVCLAFTRDKWGNFIFFKKGRLIFDAFFSNPIQRAKQKTSENLEN